MRNFLLRNLAAALLLLLPGALVAGAPVATDPIASYARAHEFSGTILVRERGRIVYARSFGLADRAFAIGADRRTRFRVASITKLFASVLVLQEVEAGRLELRRPIKTWLPDYPGGGADRVTIHHLLNHTSGIAQYDRVASLDDALEKGLPQYQLPQTPASLLARCCSGPLVREPGTAFDYNNADYIVLARILERTTGRSFEALLGDRILHPLGLANTGIAHQETVIPRLAPTYYYREDKKVWMNDIPAYFQNWDAAGAMYSTADDLMIFADALFGGRLLKPESLRLMLTPGLDDYGYGLWSYSVTRGGRSWRVAKRPGSIMGANAMLYRLIDRPATVVILANTNKADLDVLAQRIGDLLIAGALRRR
jgi:D-alanyl-D-alanine carboxypeptidase